MIYNTSAIAAMRPSARETKGGNWQPIVVHIDRVWYRNEHFPRRLKRTRDEAIATAENIILGRAAIAKATAANPESKPELPEFSRASHYG